MNSNSHSLDAKKEHEANILKSAPKSGKQYGYVSDEPKVSKDYQGDRDHLDRLIK